MYSPEAERKPRGRPRSFDRDQALETAMRLFWSRGYEATSINDLTKAIGITPPSLYGTFGDKRRLFLEAVNRYQKDACHYFGSALTSGLTAEESIRRLLLNTVDYFTDPKRPTGCMVVLSATNCGPESSDVVEALADKRRAVAKAIGARIAAGQKAGELAHGSDLEALGDLVVATYFGLSVNARDGMSRKRLRASVEELMRVWPRNPNCALAASE
jgi:AcrR family transcriptional regulator